MMAKAKAKVAEAAAMAEAKAKEIDEATGASAKAAEVAASAKASAAELDEKHGLSVKADAAKAAATAKAAELDETHGLSAKAEAAKVTASAKAAELDSTHGISEKTGAAKAAASAKAAELDSTHGISAKAGAAAAAASAKAAEIDQKLGEKINIEGFVGHTSTLDIKCKEGTNGIDDWIAWSTTEDGIAVTKSMKGFSRVSIYKTDNSIFLYEEWDQLSSQMAYLGVRGARAAATEAAEATETTAAVEAAAPLDAVVLALPFEAPDVKMYTDAVNWPCTGEKTTGEAGFTMSLVIPAVDEAKYAELLAWSNEESGLAHTAAQKGLLTLKSYKVDNTMFIWEEWESKADQEAYMAIRVEEKLMETMGGKGIFSPENPPVITPLTHVATYKAEPKPEPEPEAMAEDANPAAEAAAEPAGELGAPPAMDAPKPAA